MGTEIERRFLVKNDGWRLLADAGSSIEQFYLTAREGLSIRIRIADGRKASLTLKTGGGVSRGEFEYEIPVDDARELAQSHVGVAIRKRRYRVPLSDGLVAEVDLFEGRLAPLVIAEVELTGEDDPLAPAEWMGREITGDAAYSNAVLALNGLPEGEQIGRE